MRLLRKFIILGSVFSLSIGHAYAIQISLSDDSIDRYFRILEQYVLPLMVVSTIVLFCGYLASRIFHRTVSRRQDDAKVRRGRKGRAGAAEDGTEVFLRGLTATPPIDDSEARREPRMHPLLDRHSTSAEAAEADAADSTPSARSEAPSAVEPRAAPRPESQSRTKARRVPPLKAAFRRTRHKTAGAPKAPVRESAETPASDTGPEADADVARAEEAVRRAQPVAPLRAARPGPELRPDLRLERDVPAQSPQPNSQSNPRAVSQTVSQSETSDVAPREGRDRSPASVVKALKAPSVSLAAVPAGPSVVSPVAESAKARAGEIVDSLDYIASVLQQSSVRVAERLKDKRGLSLEDVRALAIGGYDEPQNVIEDLRMLGGDAAEEVVSAFAKVAGFNKVVRRLEQMAEAEPLDEGWNELIRSRISETIFAVGQVRKTLGIYRRTVKKPANAGHAPEQSGDSPFPVGRRQV